VAVLRIVRFGEHVSRVPLGLRGEGERGVQLLGRGVLIQGSRVAPAASSLISPTSLQRSPHSLRLTHTHLRHRAAPAAP